MGPVWVEVMSKTRAALPALEVLCQREADLLFAPDFMQKPFNLFYRLGEVASPAKTTAYGEEPAEATHCAVKVLVLSS